jgi:LPXTG-site transpeptidase (sortase) family protein
MVEHRGGPGRWADRWNAHPADQTAIGNPHQPAADGRHRSPDPRRGGASDAGTTGERVSPRAAARTDTTGVLGIVPPAPPPEPDGRPRPRPEPGRLVPLRAVRTRTGGYRSTHAALTRTTPGTVLRTTVRGVGEVLVTLGLVVLLAVGYQLWGKTAVIASEQDQLNQQLDQAWESPEPAATPNPSRDDEPAQPLGPPPGDAIARLYLPTLGKFWAVVEGIELDDIRYAPGHFPDTAMPGQIGNFSVAGHRNPATFWDLDKVDTGEPVVVETRDTWYIYTVTRNHIVEPAAVEVVAPVPGDPQATASRAMLTLVTCNPKWDNTHRLIVHAELVDQQLRSGDRPELLGDLGG